MNSAIDEIKAKDSPAQARVRRDEMRGQVAPQEIVAILNDKREYNTTSSLLANIYSDEGYFLALLESAENRDSIRKAFQFLQGQMSIGELRLNENTAGLAGSVDTANYQAVRAKMIEIHLLPPNAKAQDVIDTLFTYKFFVDNYTALQIGGTLPLLKSLGYDNIGQPANIANVYLAYNDLMNAINSACGTKVVSDIENMSKVLRTIQAEKNNPLNADRSQTALGVVTSFAGSALNSKFAECLALLADGKIAGRGSVQLQFGRLEIQQSKRNDNYFPYGEENLDAFFVLNNIVTVDEVISHRNNFGVATDWLVNQKIEKLSPEALQILAENLYLLYTANPSYAWKIESIILNSPALLKTLLLSPEYEYGEMAKECVNSRLRWPEDYRQSLERSIAVIKEADDTDSLACADFLQTALLDRHLSGNGGVCRYRNRMQLFNLDDANNPLVVKTTRTLPLYGEYGKPLDISVPANAGLALLNTVPYTFSAGAMKNTGPWYLVEYKYTDGEAEKTVTGYIQDVNGNRTTLRPAIQQNNAPQNDFAAEDTYTVQPNDSLVKIGQKTGINWQTIAALNGLETPYIIRPRQVLKLK
jgi:hypothetical protein